MTVASVPGSISMHVARLPRAAFFEPQPSVAHLRVIGSGRFRRSRRRYVVLELVRDSIRIARFLIGAWALPGLRQSLPLWLERAGQPHAILHSWVDLATCRVLLLTPAELIWAATADVRYSTRAKALRLRPAIMKTEVGIARPRTPFDLAPLPRPLDGARPGFFITRLRARKGTEPLLDVDLAFDEPLGAPGDGPSVALTTSLRGAFNLAARGMLSAKYRYDDAVPDVDTAPLHPLMVDHADGGKEPALFAMLGTPRRRVWLSRIPLVGNPEIPLIST